MKFLIRFIIGFAIFNLFLTAGEQKLPGLESLKELPVELAADFMGHEGIASPAMPSIDKNGLIFFFDSKFKQVFKTCLDNPGLTPISRNGEGPKEYAGVNDIHIHNNFLYLIDTKQKLLCFGLDGEYKWEKRTGSQYDKIAAIRGDTFYLVGKSFAAKDSIYDAMFEWRAGEKPRLLKQLPLLFMRTDAILEGKVIEGAGIFFYDSPVFCLARDNDILITAADMQYRFDILNTKGETVKTVMIDAPTPGYAKSQEQYKSLLQKKHFAIMDIFYEPPYIVVISNYFKNEKPRVDFFTTAGDLSHSFLLPLPVDTRTGIILGKRWVIISNGFLLYQDSDEVGFKVYRYVLNTGK